MFHMKHGANYFTNAISKLFTAEIYVLVVQDNHVSRETYFYRLLMVSRET